MFRSRSPIIRKVEKTTSFMTVLSRYALYSSLFWVFFAIICFVALYNPAYGEKSELTIFSSWQLGTLAIAVLAGILIFSALLGATLSLPAIILKIGMKIRVDKKSRKGQKPVILIFLATYIPILVCIISNLFVVLISTSTAPQQMRKWLDPSYKIYQIQTKIYQEFFQIKKNILYKNWKNNKIKKDAKFIFLLPQNILNYKEYFKETRKLLTKENQWLLYLPTKESITASILNEVYFADKRLFLPAPLQNSSVRNFENLENYKTKNFIGINGKNLLNFNHIFSQDSVSSNLKNTWFNVFLNRIALTQPQILLFFRSGVISSFFIPWRWENLTNSNNYLLFSYAKKIAQSSPEKENFLFFLTELEEKKENSFFKALEWPENISKQEFDNNLKEIDFNLAIAIKALKDSGIENIVIAPYKQGNNNLEYGIGFSNLDFNEQLLNTEIIRQEFLDNSTYSSCHSIALSFNLNSSKKRVNQVNTFLLDTIHSKYDALPIIKSDFMLAIRNEMRYGVICQTPKKSTYITLSKENYFTKEKKEFQFGFSNVFQQIFKEQERKNKKQESDSKLGIKIQSKNLNKEINLNEYFKQFDIFKINVDPLLNYDLVTDTEKEQFIKVYGSEVKDKFQSYIPYYLK